MGKRRVSEAWERHEVCGADCSAGVWVCLRPQGMGQKAEADQIFVLLGPQDRWYGVSTAPARLPPA